MDPVTVTWNGPLYQQSTTETPDETLTVGEYLDALIEAHSIPGSDHEITWDGEPVPVYVDVAALSGATVFVHATPAAPVEAEPEPAPVPAKAKAAKKKGDEQMNITVHTNGGREVDIEIGSKTVAAVADELATLTYPDTHKDGEFALKVDGVVLTRQSRVRAHVEDGSTVELVDVTDYEYPAVEEVQAPEAVAEPDAPHTDE